MASLATEICASRLMAPFFGDSTIVWANIIGLILIYLSLGYWLGGKVADAHPTARWLGTILSIAAACIAILPFIAKPFLSLAIHAVTAASLGGVVASFFSALLLFAVPVTLLGMVSPYAIRLSVTTVASSGSTAGNLYALSTMGSIVGTFGSALVSIPAIGTQRTMLTTALLLALGAALLLGRRGLVLPVVAAILLAIPPGVIKESAGFIAETESAYQYIQVRTQSDGARILQLNEGITTHSVWRGNTVLTGGEWDMFLAVPPLVSHPVKNVLIIGNAGGTISRAYAVYYPNAHIDGVEIDPAVTQISRQYLGLGDNPKLTTYTADGRPFLELSKTHYDVIIVDAYRQPYIPFQLATQELVQLCHDHLTDGGVLAWNVETIPGDDQLPRTLESTVRSVMPSAWTWHALKFNELLVAVNSDAATRPHLSPLAKSIDSLRPLFNRGVQPANNNASPLTDDRAPIEWLTDKGLLGYIASGGTLDESLLPTAP
jgi:spermidine synthase